MEKDIKPCPKCGEKHEREYEKQKDLQTHNGEYYTLTFDYCPNCKYIYDIGVDF